MKHFLYALLIACLAVANVAHARSAVPLVNVDRADITAPSGKAPSLKDVATAVRHAGTALGWMIETVSPGVMVGTLVVRNKHTIKVDITFTERTISFTYKDSINMKYGTNSDGQPVIHPFYMDWVDALLQGTRRELALP